MMNWKKGLAVVLAGLSLAIPLSGCKKDTADSSSEASTSAAGSHYDKGGNHCNGACQPDRNRQQYTGH